MPILRSKIALNIGLILFFTLLAFLFLMPLFWPEQKIIVTPDYGHSDALHLNYSLKDYYSQQLHLGHIPFWTNQLAGGYPILADGQTGALNLVNLMVFRLFPMPFAYNLGLLITFVIALGGMYLFLRSVRFSFMASLLGSILFSFSTFFGFHLVHYNLIQAACYLPMLFWVCELMVQRRHSLLFLIVLGAFILNQQILAGFPQMALITLMFTSLYIIWSLIFRLNNHWPKRIWVFAAYCSMVILGMGLSAIQLFPMNELLELSTRANGISAELYPYHFTDLLRFLSPNIFGSPQEATYTIEYAARGIYWENSAYIGFLSIPFILIGWILGRKKKLVLMISILIFLAIILLFGRQGPLYPLFEIFPLKSFRVPSRFLLIISFFLSVLSSYGLAGICGFLKHRIDRRWVIVICMIIVAVAFGELRQINVRYHLFGKSSEWLTPPSTVQYARSNDPLTPQRFFLANTGHRDVWNDTLFTYGWNDLVGDQYKDNLNYLSPNLSLLFDGYDLWVYPSMISRRLASVYDILRGSLFIDNGQGHYDQGMLEYLGFLNVRYLFSSIPINSDKLRLTDTVDMANPSKDSLYIYDVLTFSPPWSFAKERVQIWTIEEFVDALKQSKIGNDVFYAERVLDEKLDCNVSEAKAKIESYDSGYLLFNTSSEGTCYFSTLLPFYPGWEVLVDGQKVSETFAVNLMHTAFKLPSGEHKVEYIYRSRSIFQGLIVSLGSMLVLLVILIAVIWRSWIRSKSL